jgi:hypothetical protein
MASKEKKIAATITVAVKAAVAITATAALLVLWACPKKDEAMPDEAKAKGTPVSFFHQADNEADYFHPMDGGSQFTPAEVRGRNTWMVWTGGNEAFWDYLSDNSFGTHDLLKALSSYPCSPEQEARAQAYEATLATTTGGYGKDPYGQAVASSPPGHSEGGPAPGACANTMYPAPGKAPYRYYSRDTRFCYQGIINEPGFAKATQPDEYGLCLDRRIGPADPFDEKVYGRQSGVLGLRLYPNPNFDEKAKQRWMEAMKRDAFYTDPNFYSDRTLIRPYRVGMSCAFCHVSPHPLHPPADPENPQLADLSGTIGAQYFWFGRVLAANVTPDNFVWHLLDSQQPGAVDTSFLPSDNLVNPRAMNAIFNVAERLDNGTHRATETAAGGSLNLPEVKKLGPTFGVPHILWDGADSVGIDAALTRVYINIGEYHQEWIRHINLIVGAGAQSPITVKAAQDMSVYWNATQERAGDMAAYLIRAGYPMHLKDVPGGADYLKADDATTNRGKVVFAENCARCHSSKLPEQPKPAAGPRLGEAGCIGEHYLDCWNNYWSWTETPDFKAKMTQIVTAPDFLDKNYLSNDARIPVTLLKTEICSAMASNAVAGHVWNDFASESYKQLPSVGPVQLHEPVQDKTFTWNTPAGGRGYQRVPSLVSVWSTAPFLHNNEVGRFTGDPSVKGRMDAFDDAIHKLLWPDKRGRKVHVTDRKTDLIVSTAALPKIVGDLASTIGLVSNGSIRIGPIPKGTPVSLIGNINAGLNDPKVDLDTMLKTLLRVKNALIKVNLEHLDDAQATAVLKGVVPDLIKVSACPDFEVDRGHEFGKDLADADKEALIAFLKTL